MSMILDGTITFSDSTVQSSSSNTYSLGLSQTWQNVSASRSTGTTYYNTTGKPIYISVQINTNAAGLAYAYFNINSVDLGYFGQGSSGSPNTLYGSFCTQIIPAGATYKFTITGNATLAQWFELR